MEQTASPSGGLVVAAVNPETWTGVKAGHRVDPPWSWHLNVPFDLSYAICGNGADAGKNKAGTRVTLPVRPRRPSHRDGSIGRDERNAPVRFTSDARSPADARSGSPPACRPWRAFAPGRQVMVLQNFPMMGGHAVCAGAGSSRRQARRLSGACCDDRPVRASP